MNCWLASLEGVKYKSEYLIFWTFSHQTVFLLVLINQLETLNCKTFGSILSPIKSLVWGWPVPICRPETLHLIDKLLSSMESVYNTISTQFDDHKMSRFVLGMWLTLLTVKAYIHWNWLVIFDLSGLYPHDRWSIMGGRDKNV